MADVQLENGYMAIANSVVDALARIRIPGEAAQVLFCILRKTYGWSKKMDAISISQFVEATGINKPNTIRAIKKLEEMNIIIIERDTPPVSKKITATSRYGLNKDFDTWIPLSKKTQVSKKITTVIEKDNKPLSKKIHTTTNTTTKERHSPAKSTKHETINGWAIWIDANRAAGRQDPIPDGPDTARAKSLAKAIGSADKLRRIYDAYLADTDAWISDKGHGLRFIGQRVNKYLLSQKVRSAEDPNEPDIMMPC